MLNIKGHSKCKEKQSKVNVRQLKVQYHCSFNCKEEIPRILLQGKWLKKAGFSASDEVSITVLDKLLVIGKL